MKENELAALRAVRQWTGGRFDLWLLAGASRAGQRAEIMTAECLAVQGDQFAHWAAEQTKGQTE